jgi:hypothetical protein
MSEASGQSKAWMGKVIKSLPAALDAYDGV